MKKLHLTLLVTFFAAFTFAQDALLGKWLTQSEDGIVEIYKQDNLYYGKVVKMMPAVQEDGSEFVDENNPDKTLKERPILGINTIIGFTWDNNEQKLIKGKVYDPNNGKTYKGKIWLEGDKLKLRGYVGPFYRTETWTKAK